MGTTTKGILTPRDIDEEGRYYFVRKAMDAGDVVRLKNGVYATEDGLADTMVDVERIVPGGVLCLYSLSRSVTGKRNTTRWVWLRLTWPDIGCISMT